MKRYVVLDSWRGIAACFIVLLHCPAYSHAYGWAIIRHTQMFVDFFFVLSGFVIAANYRHKLAGAIGRFMFLRFGRLYPLHFVMLAAFVAKEAAQFLLPVGLHAPFSRPIEAPYTIVAHLFLLHGLGLLPQTSWNGPSWSISAEFWTYLLFAIAAVHVRRLDALMACLTVGGLILLYVWVGELGGGSQTGFLRAIIGFSAGVLVQRAHTICRPRMSSFLECVAVVAIILLVVFGERATELLAVPVFAATVFIFSYEGGAISRILDHRPWITLGTWSYSIYMVHAFFYDVTENLVRLAGHSLNIPLVTSVNGELRVGATLWQGDAYYVISLLSVIAISAFTYRYIEAPCRTLSRKIVALKMSPATD